MSITLEKIDMIMQRANVSYKEAKEALEKHDGDILEALIELESEQKINNRNANREHREERRYHHYQRDFWTEFSEGAKDLYKKMTANNLVLSSKEKQYMDIPMIVAFILVLVTLPASLFLLILPYCFGMRFDIKDNRKGTTKPVYEAESENTNTSEY